ncbi:MAG: lytic transglycosylase domain-containing protein [Acidimicrobiaceae bacterium]|nr:lytic transglycosylase domain-containing protein [Acidimicrobiaceae bacterium]
MPGYGRRVEADVCLLDARHTRRRARPPRGHRPHHGRTGGPGAGRDGDGAGHARRHPRQLSGDFERSGARFGVSWAVIAGIYAEECDFGRSRLAGCNPPGTENPAGAQGPGQFLPTTWRRGLAPHQLIPPGPPTPTVAEGYATDGDGDGIADPWDPADAIASTARLLAANGAASGDVAGAIFSYNHDPSYVAAVLAHAAAYENQASRD